MFEQYSKMRGSSCRQVRGGAAIPNLTREPIGNVRVASNFCQWRETAKDGQAVHEKTMQSTEI